MRSVFFVFMLGLSLSTFAQDSTDIAMQNMEKAVEQAKRENKSRYSGGMHLFQPGYTIASNERQDIKASSFAIGGILRMYFGKWLTAGIYGGTQKTTYPSANSINSYFNFGYGGPFLGLTHKSGKTRYTVSAFAGMGSIKNLHIESQTGEALTEAHLYQQSTLTYSPIFSLDYELTKRLCVTFQTICLMGKLDGGSMFFNPTMQVGLLFNR